MREVFVYFDLGGPLVDLRGIVTSMADRRQAMRVREPGPLALSWAALSAQALPTAQGPRFRSLREIASDALADLLAKRDRSDAAEATGRLVQGAWDDYVRATTLQPDVSVKWLRAVKSKVTGLGAVTDGDEEAVAGILSNTGLEGLFDSVTTSERVRSYKPDPKIFRVALKSLRAKPSESLFVSDAALDLQGAANLGMGTAWIRRGLLPDLAKPPADALILPRMEDVERIVAGYAKTGRFELPCARRFLLSLLELSTIHLDQLLRGRRILGTLVVSPTSRESREPNRVAGPRTEDAPRAGVDRAHRDLRAPHFEDRLRFEPDVGFELRVDAGRPAVPSLPLEPVRKRVQRLVIEAGAELARRAEDVGDVIVRGHEQGAVRPGAFPSARERSDHDEVDRVAERRTVLFLELDPLVSAPAGVVRGVKGLRHEPLAPGLEGFIEERFGLLHVVRHPDGRGTDLVARVDDTFEGFPPLRVRTCGQVLLRTQEAIECEEGDGEFLRHPLHFRLAPAPPADLLEREELSRVRIDRDGLAFHNRRAVFDRRSEAVDDLGKLPGNVFQMAGEELDAFRRDVRLHPQPVVLVLQGGLAHSLEDLLERLESLREHRPDRAEQLQVDVLESVDTFRGEDSRDLPEVGRHVVRALDAGSVRLRRERGRERVDDRHVRDPQPHLAHDHPDDVLRLPRCRAAQEVGQETDLPLLAPFAGFPSDRIEVLVDLRGRQGRRLQRPLSSRRDGLLRYEAEIPFFFPEAADARVGQSGRVRQDAHHHLLRESELDSLIVGVDATLGEVDDLLEVLPRRPPEQAHQ